MDVDIDTTQITKLAVDLGKVPGRAIPEVGKAIFKSAMLAKTGMAEDLSGHKGFQHVPQAVDFTIQGLEFEAGVNKDARQGSLGNILAYGGSRGGPYADHTASFNRNMGKFEDFIRTAAENAMRL